MLSVQRWSDAVPAGRVRCWHVQCQKAKAGQQKVQLYYKDDTLCPSRNIIYLCSFSSPELCMHSSGEDCNLEVPKSFKLVK